MWQISSAERAKGGFAEAKRKNNKWAQDVLLGRDSVGGGTGQRGGVHTDFRAEIFWVQRLIFLSHLEKKKKIDFRVTDPWF